VREVSDTYFGTTVADPYRWMEDKGPEVDSWLKAEAAYAHARLEALPERNALLKRIEDLGEAGVEVSGARRAGKAIFYYKLAAGQNERQLFMRASPTGPERLLVDPVKLAHVPSGDGVRYSIMSYNVSDDGSYKRRPRSGGADRRSESYRPACRCRRNSLRFMSRYSARLVSASWRG